ncbi:MAG: orotidine 5'-phosphate decarboxylase [Thermoplasmata archaeon]|nr:orotidine 5'-phosphate decarboxylase [Thermoplasmata archaeon]
MAKEAVEGGVDWLEAGTPLIKSEGMDSVRELRRLFPKYKIVADLKIMDVGGFETEIAGRAGASVVTVMGVSDDPTIEEALRAGRKYGVEIMVDLLGVKGKVSRAQEVEKMGVDYLCLHVSIDKQMLGASPCEEIKEVADAVSIPIAAAGGLNSENAHLAARAGASIIIVGGAISKAPDVARAARKIKEALEKDEAVSTELYRKYTKEGIRDALMKASAPNVADAMHKKGAMKNIRPLRMGYHMVGKALTVRTADGDWAKAVEAIDAAGEGDVIVIDAGKGRTAVWGELASWSAKLKGVSGIVVDGAIRDVDDIAAMGFPAFSRNIAPNAGEPKGFGEIGTEIVCGEIEVAPGDWIIGDDSGVVVIPKERAVEIANRALDVKERENRFREEIKRGSTLSRVLELEKWEKEG